MQHSEDASGTFGWRLQGPILCDLEGAHQELAMAQLLGKDSARRMSGLHDLLRALKQRDTNERRRVGSSRDACATHVSLTHPWLPRGLLSDGKELSCGSCGSGCNSSSALSS